MNRRTAPGGAAGDEDRIAAYVEAGLERLERGEPVDAGALCAEHPELAPAVAEALGLQAVVPQLHRRSKDVDREVGTTLGGRYRLDERIGAGAMGRVYRAFDLELGREVAVKLLQQDLFAGQRAEDRFLRESEVLASLDHPNVVRVFDRGRSEDGALFLVMELLPGASMATVIARATEVMPSGPDPETFARTDWLADLAAPAAPAARREQGFLRQAVRWCAEIADGLAAAHERGICHRDVKPSNAFVRADGSAVLLDFGIAARVGEGHLTATGTSVGTPWYMAPETVFGQRDPDPRGDVYGLAATLYHLLTLRPPFDGDASEVYAKLRTEAPPPAHRVHRGLPRDLQAVLDHGLARQPEHRYARIAAMAADLRAFLEHRPVAVRPLHPAVRVWRAARRAPARALAVLSAAVAVLLVAVVVPLWLARSRSITDERHGELVATLPALLTLESYPEHRLAVDPVERRDALVLLDQILELRHDDVQSRLMRAAIRLDLGRHELAAADLTALLDGLGSDPYVAAIAERYLRADPQRRGLGAIDLDDLPEPTTPAGHFVAGYHALRLRTTGGYRRSLEHLDAAGDHPAARDLRLIALYANDRFQEAHDEALIQEGVYGRPTARTRHILGATLIKLKRYDEAVEPLEEAIRLRPGRHGPLHNLGLCKVRLGHVGAGIELLEQAHAIRPWLWNTLMELAVAYCWRGQFDDAYAAVERIPAEGSLGEEWIRPYAHGQVRMEHALALLREEGAGAEAQARAREVAAQAVEWFRTSHTRCSDPTRQASIAAHARLCEAMATGDWDRAVEDYQVAMAGDPLNPTHLANLAVLLPENGLSEHGVELLRLILLSQATRSAPGNPELRERYRAQVRDVQRMLKVEERR